ncbi:MAG TPA: glycosyltransferase family 1 protein, partial [Nitrospirae bacterium]|nr:glycosyltransferase family 1 protein [Nitrospirota bacterium]
MINGSDLVVFLANDWTGFFRRYLFISMAKTNANCRILCVQRPICFFTTSFLNRRKVFAWFKKEQRVTRLLPNLFVYQPVLFLNDNLAPYVPGAVELNRKILSYQIMKKIGEHGLRKDRLVLWISDPIHESYLGIINEKKRVYDCFDDYFAIPGNPIIKNIEKNRLREKHILENVDLVLTVSNKLYESKSKVNNNTYMVPNAADVELFGRTSDESTAVHPDMTAIPHPIIGMVGNLHQRIDFRLIRYLALVHPEWSIVIVGEWSGADPDFINSDLIKDMKKMQNIHWMGRRPSEVLPNYLKAFDVCIIPYSPEDRFNISCSPLKLYEYLATGKPIVSTNLPAVNGFSEVVHIGNNYQEFEEGTRLALTEKNGSGARRIKLAYKNSWDNRANEIFSIMDNNGKY